MPHDGLFMVIWPDGHQWQAIDESGSAVPMIVTQFGYDRIRVACKRSVSEWSLPRATGIIEASIVGDELRIVCRRQDDSTVELRRIA